MSTATLVPQTRGELEGDEALETLRRCGRVRLAVASFQRFRAADGFSHARALAFQLVLTLVPAVIALVGLATAAGQGTLRMIVEGALRDVAPGEAGELLTEALRQGTASARAEAGEIALVAGALAALVGGTLTMTQVERGANRIYGVERDRPLVRRYLVGLALACTAGVLVMLALAMLVGGDAVRRALDWGDALDVAWAIVRWPLGLAFVVGAVALLFEAVPRRRQPEASWLAVGAALAVGLWVVFTGALALFFELSGTFGATYGSLAGTIGVLLWAFLTSIALLVGLAFAAQLEAVRAGVPTPRLDREANVPDDQPPTLTTPR